MKYDNIDCPDCNGYGSHQFCGGMECDACNGTGWVTQEMYDEIMAKRIQFKQLMRTLADKATEIQNDEL